MTGVIRKTGSLAVAAALMGAMVVGNLPAQADSTVFDGPGFKVENRDGWFGKKSTTYTDALGNQVEKKRGWFGRETTKTKLFGSEAVRNGKNMTVNGPGGKPLVTTKRTLFGGKRTYVDGNGIFTTVKDLFK